MWIVASGNSDRIQSMTCNGEAARACPNRSMPACVRARAHPRRAKSHNPDSYRLFFFYLASAPLDNIIASESVGRQSKERRIARQPCRRIRQQKREEKKPKKTLLSLSQMCDTVGQVVSNGIDLINCVWLWSRLERRHTVSNECREHASQAATAILEIQLKLIDRMEIYLSKSVMGNLIGNCAPNASSSAVMWLR